jgi:hypothetical protein
MVDSFCSGHHERRRRLVDLLVSFLPELGRAGEAASDYAALFQRLVAGEDWKHYLAVKGTLMDIARLITAEIDKLAALERATFGSDLAQVRACTRCPRPLWSNLCEGH